MVPTRQIRADYDGDTITVYQAYRPEIAARAVEAGTFVAPFSMDRMTWIKPSFLWMMYRCGWAQKSGQERVLAVRIRRTGFEAALAQACLSAFDPEHHESQEAWRAELASSPVRIQWDPERTISGAPLSHRSLQIGLTGPAVRRYVDEWVVGLDDITGSLPDIRSGKSPLPVERPYPLPDPVARHIGAT